jgi:hypothetical protein
MPAPSSEAQTAFAVVRLFDECEMKTSCAMLRGSYSCYLLILGNQSLAIFREAFRQIAKV